MKKTYEAPACEEVQLFLQGMIAQSPTVPVEPDTDIKDETEILSTGKEWLDDSRSEIWQ